VKIDYLAKNAYDFDIRRGGSPGDSFYKMKGAVEAE